MSEQVETPDAFDELDTEAGDNDHDNTSDDSEMQTEPEVTTVSQGDAEQGPDHPSEPGGLYPIPPKPTLSTWVAISNEERLEKGELYAKKMVEIEGMQKERTGITQEINKAQKEAVVLRTAFLSGKVEVMTEQTDLLRQPVGPESAAAQFKEMGEVAAQASPEAQAGEKTVEELNAMARDIQAGAPGTEPSEAFQNDVEEFKAKAAKRKNGKAQ